MGASLVYLDKPNKEIILDQGENDHLKFAAAGMQGWRLNMVSKLKHSFSCQSIIWKFMFIYFHL